MKIYFSFSDYSNFIVIKIPDTHDFKLSILTSCFHILSSFEFGGHFANMYFLNCTLYR